MRDRLRTLQQESGSWAVLRPRPTTLASDLAQRLDTLGYLGDVEKAPAATDVTFYDPERA